MDKTITIILILLMLSLITERVSNFVKLRFSALSIKMEASSIAEKIRERRINLVAVLIGVAVALASRANFFDLIQEAEIRPWESIADVSFVAVFGCLITGLFLSQGSKFFHDLLDVLLYAKNIKRSMYKNKEIINEKLKSRDAFDADGLLSAVSAEDRSDEPDNHL